MLGLGEAALFSRAQSIVSVIRNGLFAAIARPLLPALGALEAQGVGLAPLYLRVIESVTGLAWPAYVLLAIWAEPLIRLLYGPSWTGAAALVPPLAVAHGLTLAVAPHYDPLIVKRRTFLLLVCESGLFLCTLLELVFAVPRGLEVGAPESAVVPGVLDDGSRVAHDGSVDAELAGDRQRAPVAAAGAQDRLDAGACRAGHCIARARPHGSVRA